MLVPNRFIIVDDDPLNNKLCELAIRKVFPLMEIKAFTMPEMAIEYIQEDYTGSNAVIPTVLFLDINMPGLTGWDFLDRFDNLDREIHKQFTIFILSSSVDQRDIDKAALSSHVSGYISKPITKSELSELFLEWQSVLRN